MVNQNLQTVYSLEFDNCGLNESPKIEIKLDPENGSSLIFLNSNNEETLLFEFIRDQWGVYISSNDFCIAQEDGTRSFIDALIKCLIKLKNENEFNTIESTLL